MNEPTHPSRASAPRSFFRSGRHWPVLVVLVFTGNMAVAAWVLVTANSDPSFAVEKDYYTRALHWNDEIDQRKRNDELGWTVTLDEPVRMSDSGEADLSLIVLDAAGQPITDAAVTALAFPSARAGDASTIAFDGVAPGRYSARLHEPRPGMWELRITVSQAAHVFTARLGTTLTSAR